MHANQIFPAKTLKSGIRAFMSIKLNKPKPSEICPPGYHVVRGHQRVCQSGTKTWVDTHIRKNPKKKIKMLLQENLLYLLYWNSKKKYPKLPAIKGFKPYDELTQSFSFGSPIGKMRGFPFRKLILCSLKQSSLSNPASDQKPIQSLSTAQLMV